MQRVLDGLEPKSVFRWFECISGIPHGSGNERELSNYILDYFQKKKMQVFQDKAYNLIIKKPASAGNENLPTVILNAHLDMVCEKRIDSKHDFITDPISLIIEDGKIRANGTTLGADDGTGVAFALSILEDSKLDHPPLEIVLTTGEECGLLGIKQLDFGRLNGKIVLNLDCSDEGIVVGCAGASVGEITLKGKREKTRKNLKFIAITVCGLQGGHCGLHIAQERANANVLLARILNELEKNVYIQVSTVNGGTQNGAIPRMAYCVLAFPENQETLFREQCAKEFALLRKELEINDPGIQMILEETIATDNVFTKQETKQYITLLNTLPNGVQAMDKTAEYLPETSCNIGVVSTQENIIRIFCNCRSNYGSKKKWMLDKCRLLSEEIIGSSFRVMTDYPEWEYKSDSRISKLVADTYKSLEGKNLIIERSHGGNECGTFSERIAGADIVCMGTKIHNAHSPEEWVSIDIIQKEYRLLQNVLRNMKDY